VRRGDLVTVALPGSYGKPRPALIIQSDLFDEHPSLTILPITSELRATPLFRIDIGPTAANGMRKPSQIMVDKAQTIPRGELAKPLAGWRMTKCLP
jgi:mRNA interferase MazF